MAQHNITKTHFSKKKKNIDRFSWNFGGRCQNDAGEGTPFSGPFNRMELRQVEQVQWCGTRLVKSIRHLAYPERLHHLGLPSLLYHCHQGPLEKQIIRVDGLMVCMEFVHRKGICNHYNTTRIPLGTFRILSETIRIPLETIRVPLKTRSLMVQDTVRDH